MKKLVLFALIIVFCATGVKAEEKDYYEGERIYDKEDIKPCEGEHHRLRCSSPHAVVDGIVQEKYPDGSIKKETKYRAGEKYGLERIYYEVKAPWEKPGRLHFEMTYKYGKPLIRKKIL